MKILFFPVPKELNGMKLEEELAVALGIPQAGDEPGVGVSVGTETSKGPQRLLIHLPHEVDESIVRALVQGHNAAPTPKQKEIARRMGQLK